MAFQAFEGLDPIMDPQKAGEIAERVTQSQVRDLKGRVPRERAAERKVI